jgi:hypothetical protein
MFTPCLSYAYQTLNSDLLPDILHTAINFLITALVALSIFMLEKEGAKDFEWDVKVILKEVLKVRYICFAFLFLFVSLFLFTTPKHSIFHSFMLLPSFEAAIICIGVIVCSAHNCYRWIEENATGSAKEYDHGSYSKGFRNRCRNTFLNKNKDADIWLSTWHKKITNIWTEKDLIDRFISNLKQSRNDSRKNFILVCLKHFNHSLDKRALYDQEIFKKVFSFTLDWWSYYYEQAKHTVENRQPDQLNDDDFIFIAIKDVIDALLQNITVLALQESKGNRTSHTLLTFFMELKKHVEGKEDADDIKELFKQIICPTFFTRLDTVDTQTLLEMWISDYYFPPKWKTTLKTIEEENKIARIWFHNFWGWAGKRMGKPLASNQYDSYLDYVISGLFPEAEPFLWKQLLMLVIRSKYYSEPAKSLAEQPIDCIQARATYNRTEYEKEREETFKLAVHFFKNHFFTSEKLNQYIRELRDFDCAQNPSQCRVKEQLAQDFEEMKKYLV